MVSFVLCVPIHYIAFCPVDSVIHPMDNWIQWVKSFVYPDYSSVAKSNSKKLLIKYLSVPLLFFTGTPLHVFFLYFLNNSFNIVQVVMYCLHLICSGFSKISRQSVASLHREESLLEWTLKSILLLKRIMLASLIQLSTTWRYRISHENRANVSGCFVWSN